MFGCGLPVLTAAYPCISELVQHGKNGLHFSNAKELGLQLAQTLSGFPRSTDRLTAMKEAVLSNKNGTRSNWESEWSHVVAPIISGAVT